MVTAGILIVSAFLGIVAVQAAPASLDKRQTITTLTPAAVSVFKPYTFYASTAYCQPSSTLTWSCGANCLANPSFQPTASGGDGVHTQFWYVGFDPTLKTVIVGHQGTDSSKILPVLTDLDFFLDELDPKLFPGIGSSIKVHNGFSEAQAETAPAVLAAVKTALSAHSSSSVTIVGHSLGAAIALISGVYLPLHLPGITFKVIGYGMPRVGNPAFANYVDAHISVTHINNQKDPVPILPGRFLGYRHTSGEIHIQESSAWVSCPGQDNTNGLCTIGTVKNVFEGNPPDHGGPYDGVIMDC